jgi:hypothetical protein
MDGTLLHGCPCHCQQTSCSAPLLLLTCPYCACRDSPRVQVVAPLAYTAAANLTGIGSSSPPSRCKAADQWDSKVKEPLCLLLADPEAAECLVSVLGISVACAALLFTSSLEGASFKLPSSRSRKGVCVCQILMGNTVTVCLLVGSTMIKPTG